MNKNVMLHKLTNNNTGSALSNERNTQQNRSIWEIDGALRCPVIGNCLSLLEQKKILKKANISYKKMSDYEIHTILTHGISEESPLSVRIQNYLNNKYRINITELSKCSKSEFFSLWKKGLKHGEIKGLLWIAVIKLNLSDDEINTVFGDIHMLMHAQGSIVRRGLHQVDQLKEENKKLTSKLQSMQKRTSDTILELSLLSKKLLDTEKRFKISIEDNRELMIKDNSQVERNCNKKNEKLRTKLNKYQQKVHTLESTIDNERIESRSLRTELASLKESDQLIHDRVDYKSKKTIHGKPECTNCCSYNLCERRILLVGGMTKLRPFYQSLVENIGGEFKYHDGRIDGSKHRLENWVEWADIVLCPVDVNSHSACLSVKRTCKKLEKNYHMLSSSSVSSISRALENAAKRNVSDTSVT